MLITINLLTLAWFYSTQSVQWLHAGIHICKTLDKLARLVQGHYRKFTYGAGGVELIPIRACGRKNIGKIVSPH